MQRLIRMTYFTNPLLFHDPVLNSEKSFRKGLRPRRASRHVDIHGDNFVHAFAHGISELEKTAAVRAATHRDNILRIGHLIVEKLSTLGHLISERPSDDHQIRLARSGPRNGAESINIGSWSSSVHELDGTAGQTK